MVNQIARYVTLWSDTDRSGTCFICGRTFPQDCGYVYLWKDRLSDTAGKAHRKCAENVELPAIYPYEYSFRKDIVNTFPTTDGVGARKQYIGGHRFWGFSMSPFKTVLVKSGHTVWVSEEKARWLDEHGFYGNCSSPRPWSAEDIARDARASQAERDAKVERAAQVERDARTARRVQQKDDSLAAECGWARCAAASKSTDTHLTDVGRAYDVIDRLEQVVPQFRGQARIVIAEAVGRMTEETWNGMAR